MIMNLFSSEGWWKICLVKFSDLGVKYKLISLTKGLIMDGTRGRNFTCSQLAGFICPDGQHKFEIYKIPYSPKKHLGVTGTSPLTFAAIELYKIFWLTGELLSWFKKQFSIMFTSPWQKRHENASPRRSCSLSPETVVLPLNVVHLSSSISAASTVPGSWNRILRRLALIPACSLASQSRSSSSGNFSWS